MSDEESPNITAEELAKRLKVSEGTLERWRGMTRREGKQVGPRFFRLSPGRGPGVRYRIKDVEEYERERLGKRPGAN